MWRRSGKSSEIYEVCGMRCVGGQRRKGSEWWSEEVGLAVIEKRRAEEWLQRRDRDTYDRYRAQRAVVKQAVKVAKRMADWRWREPLGNAFEGKKMFWKEVQRVRKGEQRDEKVKNVNGQYCGRVLK